MSGPYSTIITRQEGAHLSIWLNRPQKRNALNNTLIAELKQVLRGAENDQDVRVITLRGKGSAFCSGADLSYLKELRRYDRQENLKDSLSLAELYLQIYLHPKPLIALVQGPALAGGCGLASVCDFILATPEAKFGYPEVKIGFIAAMVSAFLVRQIGERKARELLLSGKLLAAHEAAEWGLVSKVISSDELLTEHANLVAALGKNSSLAMRKTKEMIARNILPSITEEIKKLVWENVKFRESSDFIEGISAFIEKRKPSW